MQILAIDTSCDETSVAITDGRRVLSNVIYSQILLHKKWGGVVPSIAKRAHEERIDFVVEEALRKSEIRNPKSETNSKCFENLNFKNSKIVSNFDIRASNLDYIAVTQGPGLAVALEVGIKKAIELAKQYNKKLISVNHLEGHIYSAFVQNSQGNPKLEFNFPYLALIISGGHSEFVVFKNHLDYEVIGSTVDDAAGEALDKAAKILGLGYPGGPVIESLAREVGNVDFHHFPRPMIKTKDLMFSFSGLKTSFYYFLKGQDGRKPTQSIDSSNHSLSKLSSSFQEAVFDTLIKKTEKAIIQTGINRLVIGGGVSVNLRLKKLMRDLAKKYQGSVLFPSYKYLTGDNAAMIGVVAGYKAERKMFVDDIDSFGRIPRMSL